MHTYCYFWKWLLWALLLPCTVVVVNALPVKTISMKGILNEQTLDSDSHFKQVIEPVPFQFPKDHLVHQGYKTEWWYFSGNVKSGNVRSGNMNSSNANSRNINKEKINLSDNSHKFSYQFTLFRFALKPEKLSQAKSHWRSSNIYMGHVALTDISNQQSYQQERFSRDGLALAGAEKNEKGLLQFWLNDWQIRSMQADQLFPLQLNINNNQFELNLQLDATKPVVLQGKQGLSQKSNSSASYYYSYTRLASKGRIRVGDASYEVTGNSWFDREWSTSSLGDDQQGWDWFAIHLEDGSDVMLYQMRKKDGDKDIYSSGTLVDSQGNSESLKSQQFLLKVSDYWQSPISGVQYPVGWEILIPEKGIKLKVTASVKQQEWSRASGSSFNYWEGSIEVKGVKNHHAVTGTGYLEMTGYD